MGQGKIHKNMQNNDYLVELELDDLEDIDKTLHIKVKHQ